MRHCVNSVGVLSIYEIRSDYLEELRGEEYRIGQLQAGTGKTTSCQGPLTSCNPCEAGSLCLDPNPPFVWLKIRGLVYPLSGSGLEEFIAGF